jgi:FAD/FMN-containing dehydrogenase
VQTLRPVNQELPGTLLGVVPKSAMWRLMRPFTNDLGIRAINAAKYRAGAREAPHAYLQSHAAFAFLLDYVPDWKRAYGPGGLIQYQSFIPAAHAVEAFREMLAFAHRREVVPYLGVFKRHRRDDFLMSHGIDGYSLALDFRITRRRRAHVWALAAELDRIVLDAGGRFYPAKDSTLGGETYQRSLGRERIERFLALERACDPEGLLVTDLHRRLLPGAVTPAGA